MNRLCKTVLLTPPGGERVLELATYMQLLPAVCVLRGYKEGVGNYLGPAGKREYHQASLRGNTVFEGAIDIFDVEQDPFPYGENYFDTVLACELLEHLNHDPMHMLIEVHRVLKPGGVLVLTTPNCASWTSLGSVLTNTSNPHVFSKYPVPSTGRTDKGLRHVREYTTGELVNALESAGFQLEVLLTDETGGPTTRNWVEPALRYLGLPTENRGEQVYCVATKQSDAPPTRFPSFLYQFD